MRLPAFLAKWKRSPSEPGKVVVTGSGVSQEADKVEPGMRALEAGGDYFKKIRAMYNPDEDPDCKPVLISSEELAKRAVIPRTVQEGDHKDEATKISGTFVVQRMDGRGIREVFAEGWPDIDQMRGSLEYRGMKMRETHGVKLSGNKLKEAFPDAYSLGGDRADSPGTSRPNDEYHPLLLGPYNRNLYLFDFLDQFSKAYEGFHHNPVLKAGVKSIVQFVLGDGPKVVAANPLCQMKWDAFVERVGRQGISYQDKLRMFVQDISVGGESFLTDPDFGEGPTMKPWDATTVWEIITDPRDIENVFYAYRQFPTQYQVPYSAKPGTKMPPMQEYVIEQVPPSKWLHVKINATIGEKRGRSDLFSVLGWGKRFKDWFDAAVVNGQISNAFILWWRINGSPQDVDNMRNNDDFSKVPPPGSAWFTNEQVTPTLLRPQGGLQANDKTGEQLLSIIAVSLNLPPEYLGVAGTSTRATALVRGEPAHKFFVQRQQLVREVVMWQYYRVIAHAQARGEIPLYEPKKAAMREVIFAMRAGDYKRAQQLAALVGKKAKYQQKLDTGCVVVMPSLVPEDRGNRLRDLGVLHTQGVLSKETMATQAAETAGIKDYDFDDEQERLADEKARGIMISPVTQLPSSGNGDKKRPGDPEDADEYRRDNRDMARAPKK